MSKQLFIPKTKQDQIAYANQVNKELERVIMSWDNTLREWYPIAIKALDFASTQQLNVPQHKYAELFKEEVHGINMNVVMALCNNLEQVTPNQIGINAKKWADILMLNHAIAQRWSELAFPIQEKVSKQFEIMSGKAASSSILKAEA